MATTDYKIFEYGHATYLLSPTRVSLSLNVVDRVTKDSNAVDYRAVSAIKWDTSTFTKTDLENVCQQYQDQDDVWCEDFLSLVLLLLPAGTKCHTKSRHIITINNDRTKLPAGPLMVNQATGKIFLVSKLVDDTALAFVSSILPASSTKAGFSDFMRSGAPQIPIPSRLYYPRDASKPLNGVRIAVKDTIDLKGLRTSFGSATWFEMDSPKSTSAPCVQKLIDAGAIILGKVKTTEFAEGVDASEWLDEVCPLNPRGDGKQQASSSSTGSAAAIATYEWLDVSIGTDTGGSIRHPAAVNGCFGQRPTHGRVDLTGVLGATDIFNTVGIFARDIKLFKKVGSYLIDASPLERPLSKSKKYNLLYPTRAARISATDQHHHGQHRWFPHPEVDQSLWTLAEKQMEHTVAAMEKLLDCKRISFNINELWEATPVIGQSKNLDEAVGSIYSTITTSSALATGIDDFIMRYRDTHDGTDPPMSSVVKARLDHGRTITPRQFDAALESAQAFKEWTQNVLFGSYDQDATTLLIFPQTCGRPAYRDVRPERKELFNDTFSIYAFGYLVGCPDYTLPVAEVPYLSDVTGQTEYLPAALSLIGKPGADLDLFDVMEHLYENKTLMNLEAGSRLFASS